MKYRFKAAYIRSRYFFYETRKRFSGWIPVMLFLVSFALFALVYFPSLSSRITGRLSHGLERLTVSGHVYVQSSDADEPPLTPVDGARIEIGGFFATTDSGGEYFLDFWTIRRGDIAVIVRVGDNVILEVLQVPSTGHHWLQDWVLREE